jgi:hypothetical protein
MRKSPGSAAGAAIAVIAMTIVGATAQATPSTTYTVQKKSVGDIQVGIGIDDHPVTITPVHIGLADTNADIAANIASAIGHGATSSGNKVTVPPETAGGDAILSSVTVSKIAIVKMNVDGVSLGPLLPAGTLFFAANPISGQDTLDSDTTVTAGFVRRVGW